SLAVLQQSLQVGIIHLVQEVNGGFLVLVGPVNQDIEVVARLGGDGDKLLVAAEIIHQGGVALRGQGRAVLGFLHHHVGVVGGVLRRRLVGALGKGRDREAHRHHSGQTEGGKGFENSLILHGSCPPVRNRWEPPSGRAPCRRTAWRKAAPGSYAGHAPSGRSPGSPPRFSAPPKPSAFPAAPRSSRGFSEFPSQCAGFCS